MQTSTHIVCPRRQRGAPSSKPEIVRHVRKLAARHPGVLDVRQPVTVYLSPEENRHHYAPGPSGAVSRARGEHAEHERRGPTERRGTAGRSDRCRTAGRSGRRRQRRLRSEHVSRQRAFCGAAGLDGIRSACNVREEESSGTARPTSARKMRWRVLVDARSSGEPIPLADEGTSSCHGVPAVADALPVALSPPTFKLGLPV